MKRIRLVLLFALVLAGTLFSIAPTLAASTAPIHSVPGAVLDGPTPTPILVHPNNECSGGGC